MYFRRYIKAISAQGVGVDVDLLDDGEPLGRSSNITSRVIARIMPKRENHAGGRIEIYGGY